MVFTLDLFSLIAFGIGVWMLMDGLVFGFMPETFRRLCGMISKTSNDELRQVGLITALLGVVIVFLILSFPATG